jgi:hypothetical protein
MFMSLMKSLPMVARIGVLQRNIPKDWSVKDWTSCKENFHHGREDDIVKNSASGGAKCINAWGPTGAKGRPSRAGMGLGRSAQASRPSQVSGLVGLPFLALEGSSTLSPWRRHHSPYKKPFALRGHPQARERGGRSSKEDRPTRRKHPQVEKKEDTVGSVTMINGATSTLMGKSSHLSMGCNRPWDVITTLLEHLSIILCWICFDV